MAVSAMTVITLLAGCDLHLLAGEDPLASLEYEARV
jgi:hypothetical protein